MPQIHPVLPADGDDAVVEPYNAAINLMLGVLNGSIDADNLADGAVTLSKMSAAVQASLTPSGSIIAFGGITPPTGYLMCDGTSYLRGTYPALFAVLGTNYGSADGTHFNVPDMRGRVPVGTDNAGGTSSNRIQRSSTLTTVSGSPTATVGSATGLAKGMFVTNANVPAGTTIVSISGTTLTLSGNASANGTTVTARFSLYANDATVLGSAGGVDVYTLVVAELAAHSHTIGAGQNQFVRGGTGDNAANITQGGTAFRVTPGPLDNTGSDQPHGNVQPGQLVNYIVKV